MEPLSIIEPLQESNNVKTISLRIHGGFKHQNITSVYRTQKYIALNWKRLKHAFLV
jgi:hypothetical protein